MYGTGLCGIDVVSQPVGGNGIIHVVSFIRVPVGGQLLGAQYQHRLVAALVVFDDGQRCEGLAQTDAVGEDAAVELLQLVDDRQHSVPLEVVQPVPNLALLEAGGLIGPKPSIWMFAFWYS